MSRLTGREVALFVAVAFIAAIALARPAAAADDAAAIYNAKCKPCHGVKGDGDTGMGKKLGVKSLKAPEAQKLSDDEMTKLIAKGKGKMPAFEKQLTPEKIKLVVGYVRALAKS